MELVFEWDSAKAEANERKHGVSFAEAATVFGDPLSAILPDPDHSEEEDRFLLLGRSSVGRILIVVATERDLRV
ncbi:MAG: BrnT family toxin [Gemmatimonadota bacterium]